MSEHQKTRVILVVILLLCLAGRVGYVHWYLQEPRPVHGDGYAEIAQSIVTGKGFSLVPIRLNWFRTPGYPLFIAAAWSVVPTWARYPAPSGGPGWRLGGHVRSSVRDCQCGSVGARPWPEHFSSPFAVPDRVLHVGLPETLQLFSIALAALLALQLYSSARLAPAIGLGLVWGAAGLTRPEATFLLAPLVLPVLVVRNRRVLARLSLCATAVLGKIAVMAPWVVRNYLVYGTFVLHVPVEGVAFAGRVPVDFISPEVIAARQEYRLAIPVVEGMPVWPATHRIPILPDERYVLEINRKLKSLGMTNFKTDKITQLLNRARHVNALWGYPAAWWDHWGVEVPRSLEIVWYGCYLALLGFFALGIVVAWNGGTLGVVPLSWLVLVAGHMAVFLFMFATARYQVTPAIFVYIFSGLGAAAILDILARGRRPAPVSSAADRAGTAAHETACETPGSQHPFHAPWRTAGRF